MLFRSSIDLYAYQPTIIIEVLIYRLFFIDSILLLVSVLLPFFDSIHVDNIPSYEHSIALVDDIPGTTVIPK